MSEADESVSEAAEGDATPEESEIAFDAGTRTGDSPQPGEASVVAEVVDVVDVEVVVEVEVVDVEVAEVAVEEDVVDLEEDPALDDPVQLGAAIEAILFVVDIPLTLSALASTLRRPVPAIEEAVAALRAGYDERGAGIELRDAAGGVRLYTRPTHARHVERFLQDGQRSRLSQAALETLAVIAYRQPVTRSRVSAIRGVNVDGVVRTLLTRGLIVEVGNDPESGAGLFRTSELFLERMGMQSLEELPSLAPLLPEIDGLESEEL